MIQQYMSMAEYRQKDVTELVIDKMKPDARFSSLLSEVTEVETLYHAWLTKAGEASNRDLAKIELKNQARIACITKLQTLAVATELLINGNRELALETGFKLTKAQEVVSFLPKPVIRKFYNTKTAGEVKLRWDAIRGTLTYVVESSTDGVTWTSTLITARHIISLSGQPQGQKMYFRVKAVGARVSSDFSMPVYLFIA